MLLIVLPSSGQSHPLEAQIIALGRGEALDCKPSRAETSLVLCKSDLHISKEAETWQGQVPAQAECTPQPCLCFGLRKGKIPLLGLRGLGKSRVQFNITCLQHKNHHQIWALGRLSKRTCFLPPPCFLPPLSHTRHSSSLDAEQKHSTRQ